MGWQFCVFRKEVGRLQGNATLNTSRSFQGARGWVLLQFLHNLTSSFSPQRSHHHLPSPQSEAFGDPRVGRLLGGNTYKWVFVSQGCFTMVQVMGLGEGAYSGVSEANEGISEFNRKP